MFRYEVDSIRKILVLVVHGTQDGWEAQLMRIDWPVYAAKTDDNWNFILDLGEYISPNGTAQKEQLKLSSLINSHPFAKKFLVPSRDENATKHFAGKYECEERENFISAWRAAGGDSRDQLIIAPEDGSRYPANNKPPFLE